MWLKVRSVTSQNAVDLSLIITLTKSLQQCCSHND